MSQEEVVSQPTLRETLESSIEQVEAQTVEPIVEGETAEQREARQRDDKGRFAKSEAQQAEKNLPPEIAKVPRPSSWKKDYWDKWDTVIAADPDLAKYITEREGQFASGVSTYKAEAENARALQDAVAPFMGDMQKHNIHPSTWIRNLGIAHKVLVDGSPMDKLQMVSKLAQDYQIDLRALFDPRFQQAQQFQPQPQMPDVQALVRQELETVQSRNEVQRFLQLAQTSDKYPHFEQVKESMIGLLQSELAKDLDDAYDQACWRDKEVRSSILAQQETAKASELAAKATQARAKVVSPKSSTPAVGSSKEGAKDRRSVLEEAFGSLESRV